MGGACEIAPHVSRECRMKRSRLSLRAEELLSYFTGLAPVGSTIEVPIAQARDDLRLGGEWVYYKYIRQLISHGLIRRVACGSQGSTGVLMVLRRLEDVRA